MRRSESIDLEQATYTVTYFVADSLMVTYTEAPQLLFIRRLMYSVIQDIHVPTCYMLTCWLETLAMLGLFHFSTRQVVERPCEARNLGVPFSHPIFLNYKWIFNYTKEIKKFYALIIFLNLYYQIWKPESRNTWPNMIFQIISKFLVKKKNWKIKVGKHPMNVIKCEWFFFFFLNM